MAPLSASQPDALREFLADPKTAPTLDTSNPIFGALAFSALGRDDVLIPSVAEPIRIELDTKEFIRLTSESQIDFSGRTWTMQLNPEALSRLLSGRRASLAGSDGQNIGLFRVRIRATGETRTAPLPAIDEVLIRRSDLPRFLEAPYVPGTKKLLYRVTFTESKASDFLQFGAVTLDVGQGKTLSIVVTPDETKDVVSGLSFRRDIWSPVRVTQTLGVMTRGDLASAKAIRDAAREDLDNLLDKMRRNLRMASVDSQLADEQQVVLVIPWERSVESTGQTLGQRRASITLMPGEMRRQPPLAAPAPIRMKGQGRVGSVSISTDISVDVREDEKTLIDLDRRLEDFSQQALSVTPVTITRLPSSSENGSSRLANLSRESILQIDHYETHNTFSTSVTSSLTDAQLGVMIANPFQNLLLDTEVIMRYRSILKSQMLEPHLSDGFAALGRLAEKRDVATLAASSSARMSGKDSAKGDNGKDDGASKASTGSSTPAQLAIMREQRVRLEEQAAKTLRQVQTIASIVFDEANETALLESIATIGNRNAAEVLETDYGSADTEQVQNARRWLAKQAIRQKFQGVYTALNVALETDDELDVYEWGERFLSTLPTRMHLFEFVNISNEAVALFRDILRPVLRPLAIGASDLQGWWQKLNTIGLLSPEDLGLSRAIERFLVNYRALLGLDERVVPTNDSTESETRVARELLSHVRDNSEHYAQVIFSSLPQQVQVSLLQAVTSRLLPSLPLQAFDFERVWAEEGRVVVALNSSFLEGAESFLDRVAKTKNLSASREHIRVPAGEVSRASYIAIPEVQG